MDDERAFGIVLEKLLEASSECEKLRGERDIARSERSQAVSDLQSRERDLRNIREVVDFTTSDAFQATLKNTRAFLVSLPERNLELERLLKDAIEKTDPIPF